MKSYQKFIGGVLLQGVLVASLLLGFGLFNAQYHNVIIAHPLESVIIPWMILHLLWSFMLPFSREQHERKEK